MQSTNSEYGSPYLAVCHVTFAVSFMHAFERGIIRLNAYIKGWFSRLLYYQFNINVRIVD